VQTTIASKDGCIHQCILVTTFLIITLSQLGSGGYFNSGSGATGQLASGDEFFGWIEKVSMNIFTDSICGDGVCDSGEYPGFGRFGYAKFQQQSPSPHLLTRHNLHYPNPKKPYRRQTTRSASRFLPSALGGNSFP